MDGRGVERKTVVSSCLVVSNLLFVEMECGCEGDVQVGMRPEVNTEPYM